MVASIHDLLQLVRKQNGALLGRRSAETLFAFLQGYALARSGPDSSQDYEFLGDFNDWVRRRFRVESTQGWAQIIAFYCNDGPAELDLFWKLYDQYMAKPQVRRRTGRAGEQPLKAKKTG